MTTYNETATDSLTATAGVADLYLLFYLNAADSFSTTANIFPLESLTLTESIAFTETLTEVYIRVVSVTDSVNILDAATPGVEFNLLVTDSVSLAELVTGITQMLPVVTEALSFSESTASKLTAVMELLESIVLREGTERTGAQYVGWVVNADTFAVSRYENWGVQSGGLFQDKYIGVGPAGVYELEGADDAGVAVDAFITLPRTDFGVANKKGLQYLYAGIKADGGMVVRVTTDDGNEYTYDLDARSADEFRNARAVLGKGLKSRYYELDLENDSGADFEIDTVEVTPIQVKRRL